MDLMTLYDNNYRRLDCLLGGLLPGPGESFVSRVAGEPALYLDGLERSRFTQSFRLTHWFDDAPEPDLIVRVYHDARLAEAMTASRALADRWAQNRLLNAWLGYCHARGHRFGPIDIALREPIDAGLR